MGTYVKGNMANDSAVVWQADIGVMLGTVLSRTAWARHNIIDNKCALDVHLDNTRGKDCIVNRKLLAIQIRNFGGVRSRGGCAFGGSHHLSLIYSSLSLAG